MKRTIGSLLTGLGLSLSSAAASAETSESTLTEVNAEANTTDPANAANSANAQPSAPRPLSVDFHGPPECGDEARLEQETRALLGEVAETANVRVTARAERTEAGQFQVYLEFSGSVLGKRKLESAECREALQAAAVILALAINPEALHSQPAEGRASAPESPTKAPRAEGDTKREREEPVRASKRLAPFLAVEARVSGGVSPAPAFGPQISFGVDYERLRVLVQGYAEYPGRESLGAESEVRLRAYGVGLRGCGAVIKSAQASAYLCAGLSLSHLVAVPEGLEEEVEQRALLFVPEAGLGLGIELHPRLVLGVRADLLVPTTNPSFTVDNGAEIVTVHQVSVGGAGAAGLTFNLGRRDRGP